MEEKFYIDIVGCKFNPRMKRVKGSRLGSN